MQVVVKPFYFISCVKDASIFEYNCIAIVASYSFCCVLYVFVRPRSVYSLAFGVRNS